MWELRISLATSIMNMLEGAVIQILLPKLYIKVEDAAEAAISNSISPKYF